MENTVYKKIIQEYYSKRAGDYDQRKVKIWKSKQGFRAKTLNEVIGDAENARGQRF
jgi:hypothetical protein